MEKEVFRQTDLLSFFLQTPFTEGKKAELNIFSSNKMDLENYFQSLDLSVKLDGTCTMEKSKKEGHHTSQKV